MTEFVSDEGSVDLCNPFCKGWNIINKSYQNPLESFTNIISLKLCLPIIIVLLIDNIFSWWPITSSWQFYKHIQITLFDNIIYPYTINMIYIPFSITWNVFVFVLNIFVCLTGDHSALILLAIRWGISCHSCSLGKTNCGGSDICCERDQKIIECQVLVSSQTIRILCTSVLTMQNTKRSFKARMSIWITTHEETNH